MKLFVIFLSLSAIAILSACGGGIDYKYACEQQIACAKANGDTTTAGVSVDDCVKLSEGLSEALGTETQKAEAEKKFDTCKSKTGCDFTKCTSGQ
ncbi:MAG: hypothetical protein GMKNLPBB_01239 [Myxococcota bacterium]|nr:hypothetical protein [Myxococcota bacterium]